MIHQRGFTLIELLVAMGMAAVVMAAIFLSYQAQVQSKIAQEVTLEEQQSGRAGLERMSSDILMAGCNPTGKADAGFETADSDEIEFRMDISGGGNTGNESNGVIDQPDENIRYAINGDGHLVRDRLVGGASIDGGGIPLIRNVDALDFIYLDIDGGVLDPTDPSFDIDDIRSVQVSMVIRGGEGTQPRGLMRTYTDTTIYRNQQGESIFVPDNTNNKFRRLQLSTTVHCRNMGR
jgi:type IV pilus assembly protein PilW